MQKVYLLLRSNKKTGPYTLEELLQFNLKPFDLVWVEGRSAAWQYPFEIAALKPYVPETPQAGLPFQPVSTAALEGNIEKEQSPVPQQPPVSKKVFVTLPKTYKPANELPVSNTPSFSGHKAYQPREEKLEREEIKAASFVSSQTPDTYINQRPAEEEIHTSYSRSIDDVEQDYTNWIYKQKTKKKSKVNPKELLLAGLILVVIAGGYYVMSKPSVANSVLPANNLVTQSVAHPIENQPDETPVQQEAAPEQPMIENKVPAPETKPVENKTVKNPSVSTNQTTSSVPPVKNSMPVEKTSNIPEQNEVIISKEPEEQKQTTAETPEKKKKLKEVLKGIFTKKEKEEVPDKDVALEDPKPAENRQATRRGNDNTTTEANKEEMNETALASQVDLSSNAPDNWMMGIKNLKITLRNRSSATIQTAAVTVSYYDGNNQLMEKKLVYFNNVAPKSRATVAAPDHKWADHVDFKLTTVSAKDDRFASN